MPHLPMPPARFACGSGRRCSGCRAEIGGLASARAGAASAGASSGQTSRRARMPMLAPRSCSALCGPAGSSAPCLTVYKLGMVVSGAGHRAPHPAAPQLPPRRAALPYRGGLLPPVCGGHS